MKLVAFIAFLFAFGCCVGHLTGCSGFPSSVREAEAEVRYGAEQYKECIAPEPILSSRATRDERLAAWSRVDECRSRVRARWGITETVTDAGAR